MAVLPRSALGRRFTFLVQSYSAELGGALGEPERTLVKQLAALQIKIEQMQAAIIGGTDVDADQIIRLSSEHRRLLATSHWPTRVTTRGPCRLTSVTRTSSIQYATPSCRRTASGISGESAPSRQTKRPPR
jgi:hypothetical protein